MPKKYIPNEKEKYMNEKQKAYFKNRLLEWKKEIIKSNNQNLYLNEADTEISSPDVIDQASSQTEKTVEMRTLNRQIKLLSKIEKAIKKIQDNTYGYCEETGEPIGIKRLIARPIASLSIEAQEKHEKNEKIFADI
tara:strand:- start:1843 stop:2250 length:408 start_codon:yes stop_codon:yes gene_type:complete